MAPICVHRAPRTPPDIALRHIRPRGDLPEAHRPATHGRQSPVGAMSHAFLQITWHGNRHSRCLKGIFARAMAPICVHRAPRTPPDIATRHISSRDDLLESVTSIGEAAFYNCPTIIYVPLGSEGTYKKGWSKYRSRIFGYDYSAAE